MTGSFLHDDKGSRCTRATTDATVKPCFGVPEVLPTVVRSSKLSASHLTHHQRPMSCLSVLKNNGQPCKQRSASTSPDETRDLNGLSVKEESAAWHAIAWLQTAPAERLPDRQAANTYQHLIHYVDPGMPGGRPSGRPSGRRWLKLSLSHTHAQTVQARIYIHNPKNWYPQRSNSDP